MSPGTGTNWKVRDGYVFLKLKESDRFKSAHFRVKSECDYVPNILAWHLLPNPITPNLLLHGRELSVAQSNHRNHFTLSIREIGTPGRDRLKNHHQEHFHFAPRNLNQVALFLSPDLMLSGSRTLFLRKRILLRRALSHSRRLTELKKAWKEMLPPPPSSFIFSLSPPAFSSAEGGFFPRRRRKKRRKRILRASFPSLSERLKKKRRKKGREEGAL